MHGDDHLRLEQGFVWVDNDENGKTHSALQFSDSLIFLQSVIENTRTVSVFILFRVAVFSTPSMFFFIVVSTRCNFLPVFFTLLVLCNAYIYNSENYFKIVIVIVIENK